MTTQKFELDPKVREWFYPNSFGSYGYDDSPFYAACYINAVMVAFCADQATGGDMTERVKKIVSAAPRELSFSAPLGFNRAAIADCLMGLDGQPATLPADYYTRLALHSAELHKKQEAAWARRR